ncbi:SMEK domain-containing protein [Tychonema sp. BBK16]|uniref:SMEK domain-containing protein n=1 Tax=Tychonema sp. BBK16 TaxID=2699888 RepID=UPI0038D30EA0
MNLERSQKRIRDFMSLFVKQVEGATAMGQTDINKVAETILIPLLAEVYGYKNLENFNFTKGSNFPSVDLGDETAKVVFQITATPTLDKVKDTLRKFIEHKDKLYEKYDKLIIYILTKKQPSYSDTEINKIINGKLSFDVKKDIWDSRNILGEVTKFQIEKTREVEKILEANFGEERREPDWEVVDKVEQIINESTELFVGRSEEFLKLDNFLADNSSGVMLVKAAAGSGKTALLANWVKERQGNGCFIADHFFSQQYDKTRSVKSAYWNLLRQIYRYYELYDDQLPNELDELRKRLYNILKERGAREDDPLVIVIDALDEIDAADIPFSLPFLTSLPQNVFVIASARAELGEEPKYLENWSERSQKLHLDYLPCCAIADWLKQTGDGELAVFAEDSNFVTKLDEITEGFPLYLSYLIDELSQAVKQGINLHSILEQTPLGFSTYVQQQFKQLANVEQIKQQREVKELFALLSVALGVLSEDDIQDLTNLDEWGLAALPWQATRWFSVQKGFYSFAHPLLAKEFQSVLGRQAQQARDKLIKYCARWQEKSIPYALRHYAEHLREVKHWEELYAIARNADFYSHSIEQFPDEPDLPLKTVQTALLAAAEEDKAGEMAEFMLLHARQLLQTTAQDSPLETLRKGYLERAWKLTDLYEIEYRILWYLLLAWELKDTGKFEEARETLKRLQQQELPRLSTNGVKEWQSESAAYLLAHIFEVSEDICTSLEQKLLNNFYRLSLCIELRNCGNLPAATKIMKSIRPESQQVLRLLKPKAQIEGDRESEALETVEEVEAVRADFATVLIYEQKPEISISFIRASALARVAEVQVKNDQKEVGATTAHIACEIAKNIDNPAEKTNLLAGIVQILVEAEKIQEAKIICDRAFEIAQQISKNREHQRSQSFGLIAEAQARVGEFDVALRTLEKINIPCFHVNALRNVAQLQIEAEPQQIEKCKIALNKADEYYKSADPLSFEFLNMLKALTIIATIRSTVGETEAALATFADLLEAAKIQKQRERDKDLSTIAIGYAEVGKFPAAIEIINEIEDGSHKISALWAIAWEQFKKGEQVTILDITLAAKEKIKDEKKRLQAFKRIAKIQAIVGQGEEAVRTVEAIITDHNKHLPDIALLFAETGDKPNFKKLLIPCAYYLDAAYQMCGYLARLYPEQASAVAKVLSELNGKER